MNPATNQTLASLTTLQLGGPAERLVRADSAEELVQAVFAADAAEEAVFVLGGGSNIVVSDAGIPGTVVQVRSTGVQVIDSSESGDAVLVTVAAGEDWGGLVDQAVQEGWSGIEALAGIPGRVGAAPIQNIGAYGQEVAETITSVRALDRLSGQVITIENRDCRFEYRDSRFKGSERFVILDVTFRLARSPLSGPVRYRELAASLRVKTGQRVPLRDLQAAVLDLRRSKGMVLDEADPDSRSAGSFFVNPVLTEDAAAVLPAGAPRWPLPGGQVKTSAAWLIEQAGFKRGYGPAHGRVALSGKHTLALTNRGGATTTELLALAREVREGVQEKFGVLLVPEPQLVNCTL